MPLAAHGVSLKGRRKINEDAMVVDAAIGLFVVADGMGGHNAGEVASGEAVDALHAMVKREEAGLRALEELAAHDGGKAASFALHKTLRVVESAVQAATYMVFGLGQANPDQRGMGTTLSVLLVRGGYAITAQVGDSRIYMKRDNAVEQLTEDHTLVAWQLKKGLITEEQARVSRQKNVITRAVGSREYVQVDTRSFPVFPGDRFLVCSDGLHGYLEEFEIGGIMGGALDEVVARAIQLANQRGGRDNITAIAVELTE